MSASHRIGRVLGRLAMVLQVAMSVLPLADAALFHRDRVEQVVHIEAAGVSCHAGDCVLGQTLQSAGEGFHDAATPSLLGDLITIVRRPATTPTVRRAVGIPVGPRAPPLQH